MQAAARSLSSGLRAAPARAAVGACVLPRLSHARVRARTLHRTHPVKFILKSGRCTTRSARWRRAHVLGARRVRRRLQQAVRGRGTELRGTGTGWFVNTPAFYLHFCWRARFRSCVIPTRAHETRAHDARISQVDRVFQVGGRAVRGPARPEQCLLVRPGAVHRDH